MAKTSSDRPLTGRTVAMIVVGAFSVVIAVNLVLAWKAVSTFPGLEARNGYIASQGFEARRTAQAALGWTLDVAYAGGELVLTFRDAQGGRVSPAALDVLVGRTTETADDRRPAFAGAAGRFAAPLRLEPGKWLIKVEARADDGTPFVQRRDIFVQG